MTSFEPVDSGQTEGVEAKNPAWQEFVGDADPEIYQKYIEPAFTKWDQSVNQRFNKVQQEYEPWKDVIKNADPQTAGFAINFLNALNNNPAEILPQVAQFYKIDQLLPGSQGQGQTEPKAAPVEDPWVKDIAELRKQNEIMAQALLQRHQQEEDAKADAWVDQELARLKQENAGKGDFNEQWVCAMSAQTGVSLDEAVKSYYEWADQVRKQSMPRPLISPGGGGSPGAGGINVRKMDNNATKSLIVDILNANNAARNQ